MSYTSSIKKLLLVFAGIVLLGSNVALAQKWQPGYFYDIKGNKVNGLIQSQPDGKGPIKNEGFILYKADNKGNEIKLSASDLKYYVAGKDSFVVAHAPANESWARHDLDFVKVELDEPLKLYIFRGNSAGGGGGFKVRPSFSGGLGGGGYGGGYGGGGVGISLGNGGYSSSGRKGTIYYFGATVAGMNQITPQNFRDVMTDMMADEPEAVDAIQSGKYNLDKIEELAAFYKQLKASR